MTTDPAMVRLLGVARAGRIAARVLHDLRSVAAPGTTTGSLDRLAWAALADVGATASMLGHTDPHADPHTVTPFPAAVSVSINDEIAGGSDPGRSIRDGDLVTADLVVGFRGWHADAACSWVVGPPGVHPERAALAEASQAVTRAGLGMVRHAVPWAEVVGAMADRAAALSVVILKGYDAHAIGRAMHEPPRLPTHPGELALAETDHLQAGMVITIEPVVGWTDPGFVRDGWLDRTRDGSDACYTEMTVGVGRNRAVCLTGIFRPVGLNPLDA